MVFQSNWVTCARALLVSWVESELLVSRRSAREASSSGLKVLLKDTFFSCVQMSGAMPTGVVMRGTPVAQDSKIAIGPPSRREAMR